MSTSATTATAEPQHGKRRTNTVLALVVLLPLGKILATGFALWIFGFGGFDEVDEPVQRTARIQVTDLRADYTAQAAGLRAEANVEAGRLTLVLHGTAAETLRLKLEHPTDAGRDRKLALVADGNGGWSAPWPAEPVAWHVALGPDDGAWRLVGRWPRSIDGAVVLKPALAAP